MEGRLDGKMEGRVDGWTDGWIDRYMGRLLPGAKRSIGCFAHNNTVRLIPSLFPICRWGN